MHRRARIVLSIYLKKLKIYWTLDGLSESSIFAYQCFLDDNENAIFEESMMKISFWLIWYWIHALFHLSQQHSILQFITFCLPPHSSHNGDWFSRSRWAFQALGHILGRAIFISPSFRHSAFRCYCTESFLFLFFLYFSFPFFLLLSDIMPMGSGWG